MTAKMIGSGTNVYQSDVLRILLEGSYSTAVLNNRIYFEELIAKRQLHLDMFLVLRPLILILHASIAVQQLFQNISPKVFFSKRKNIQEPIRIKLLIRYRLIPSRYAVVRPCGSTLCSCAFLHHYGCCVMYASIKTRTDRTDTNDLSRSKQPSPSSTGTSAVQPRRNGKGSPLTTRTNLPHSPSPYAGKGSPTSPVPDSPSSYHSARGSFLSSQTDSPRSSFHYSAKGSPRSSRTDSPRSRRTSNELGSPRSSRIDSPRSRRTSNELGSPRSSRIDSPRSRRTSNELGSPRSSRIDLPRSRRISNDLSVNSRKSSKNVRYPGRVRPTVPLKLDHVSISPDALLSHVWFLCTTTLRHTKSCLLPAGEVLLQSLEYPGDRLLDEETLCCAELFVALAHEVLLKDAVGAVEFEDPCNILHATFKDILFKPGAFALPNAPKSLETGLKAPFAAALVLQQLASMLMSLSYVLTAFEGALNKIKPSVAKDGALGNRMALLELPTSAGLTLEKYHKMLRQNLERTLAQLNKILESSKELPPLPSTSESPMVLPHKGVPESISIIDEVSEPDGDGSTANGSHSTRSHSDSEKRSLAIRIFRNLIPRRKEV
ncbi:hypothetical protein EI94DRAFT_147959 [Lactarius quietus]|nr:hypothetical protein EI94DRAFT_147959 [Lactarius quietus]